MSPSLYPHPINTISPATSAASTALQNATSKPAISTFLRKTSTMPTVLDARTSWNPCLMAAVSASMHHTNLEVRMPCLLTLHTHINMTIDCHYRWYTVAEICMILERFDSIVFVGDSALETIYNGFNVLLRQDLASGALKTWDMDKNTLHTCRCDNQFTSQACTQFYVTNSGDVVRNSNNPQTSAYLCHRTPHAFLPLSNSPAPNDVLQKFKSLVPPVPQSNYKPVPIIHSLSPSTASAEAATKSLLEFLALADASKRKTPMLWIGPTAAGHVEIKNRKGNQEIWDFDKQTARVAMENDVEVLKMRNMTVQAGSWDGLRFGERVAIIQAMMVINWLGRLESS